MSPASGSHGQFPTRPEVLFRAQETLAGSNDAGWASPAHITFAAERRPQTADRRDWEWRGMPADPESAIERIAGSTERPRRTTTVATLSVAQNGTYVCAREAFHWPLRIRGSGAGR